MNIFVWLGILVVKAKKGDSKAGVSFEVNVYANVY